MKTNPISTINFHLWEPCNMRCGFCFATFQDVKQNLPKGHLPKEEALRLVQLLGESQLFQKITFVGGEPTLCPWLLDLVKMAKSYGLATCVVSNGAKLAQKDGEKYLSGFCPFLDWFALSIDSLHAHTNLHTGRAVAGTKVILKEDYLRIIRIIHDYGFSLKINTVVNQFNFEEDFTDFIQQANPKRWKILQVLPIIGQNDNKIIDFVISDSQFAQFIQKHQSISDRKILDFVPETNDHIKGSYLMIDPAGRFFDNLNGTHEYGKPILEIGLETALAQNQANYDKFVGRGGLYQISPKNLTPNNEVDITTNLLTL